MEIDRALLPVARYRPSEPGAQGNTGRAAQGRDRGLAGCRQPAGGRFGAAGRSARGRSDRPGRPGHAAVRRPGRRRTTTTSCAAAARTTQFLRAPFAFARRLRDCDVVVEVCNGMPFLAPLWSRKPSVCMVNHVHSDLWPLRFRPPVSTAGRFLEQRVMPWAHRRNLVLTVSASTARELQSLGVDARAHPHAEQRRRPGRPAGPALGRADVPGARPAGRVQAHRPAAPPVGPGAPGGRRAADHRGRRPRARLSRVAGRSRGHVHRPGQRSRRSTACWDRPGCWCTPR